MFENATLASGPAGKRLWTTFAGMTSQILLVGFAVTVPMVFPQVLPQTQLLTKLQPPVPPGPKLKGDPVKRQAGAVRVVRQISANTIFSPPILPARVLFIEDEPAGNAAAYVPGGSREGSEIGIPGGFFKDLVPSPVIPRPVEAKPPEPAPAPVVTRPDRVREGGRVQLGRLLRRVEPVYPQLAKTSHTSGQVVLECVVGTDGHIKEIKIMSGNPLLVYAARDAVRQWVYEGSQLNGVPVEIIAQVSVNFKLN